jgi:hypothetical protein
MMDELLPLCVAIGLGLMMFGSGLARMLFGVFS